MTLPGIEKRVNVTLILNERDIRLAANLVADKGYRVLAVRRPNGMTVEIDAFFGATDIFDAFNQLEDDDLYADATSVEIQGYLNTKKKVPGVA